MTADVQYTGVVFPTIPERPPTPTLASLLNMPVKHIVVFDAPVTFIDKR